MKQPLLFASLCILFVVAAMAEGQRPKGPPQFQLPQPKRLSSFPWMDGKWKPDPPELVSFRKYATSLFREDVMPQQEVDSLFKTLIARYRSERSAVDLGKILILEAYFPERHVRHRFDIVEEVLSSPGIACYEFARAAWCVLVQQQDEIVKWGLYKKLRTRDPDDVVVKWSAIQMYGGGWPGEPPLATLPKFADELLAAFPKRDEFLLMPAIYGYAKYYVRQKDRPIEVLQKLVALGRRHVAHPQVPDGLKNMTRTFIKQYEDELKRRGG